MITLIPLSTYLQTNELTPDMTLTAKTRQVQMTGRFLYENRKRYMVQFANTTDMAFPERELYVPINIQKFFVLSPDSSDIKKL